MEAGRLSRVIGRTWRELWPRVKKLEERKDVGRALSVKEQRALLDGLKDRRTPHLGTLVPLLLLAGMRAGEALSLTWGQADLMGKTLTVGRAKTSNGTGRIIPINDDLASVLAAHRAWFAKEFGDPKPDHHLFPWGKPVPSDPTRLAENGVPESAMLALMGQMSRSMLERYSHIRITAKRDAVEAVDVMLSGKPEEGSPAVN